MLNFRRFTSLCITFSFLVIVYTGIMLFITPHGKIAYWTNWEILGLTKTQYESLHVTFIVLFLTGMILHIYLNWKPLMQYLKNENKEFSLLSKEFILALGFTIVFIFGTLYQVVPFKTYLDFEESIKQGWEKDGGIPPYGHAELSSLKTICKRTDIDLDKAIALLKEKGYVGIKANKNLLNIAIENNVSPSDIYNIIDIEENEILEVPTTQIKMPKVDSGLGKLSLGEVSKTYGLNLEKAISVINKDTKIANKNSKMKKIANELELTPIELFEKLL